LRFVRAHHQQNLIFQDKFKEKSDSKKDRLKDEVFEISSIKFVTDDGSVDIKDADKIIESQNYFTIIQGNKYTCLKWSSVIMVEFVT
jgi:hypothetical protein